jgi:hypothetical protein
MSRRMTAKGNPVALDPAWRRGRGGRMRQAARGRDLLRLEKSRERKRTGEGEPAHGTAETRRAHEMGGKCGHVTAIGGMVRDGKDRVAPSTPTRPVCPP